MSDSPGSERHDPFAALRYPSFQLSSSGRFLLSTGSMLLSATIFWQVYQLTKSELDLAVVGLVQFVPTLLLSLPAGAVADRVDRRALSLISQVAMLGAGLALWLSTANGYDDVALVYAMAFLVSVGNAFDWPARSAMLPAIVPREVFQNAIMVQSTFQQLGFVTGPAMAGFLIHFFDPEGAYLAYVIMVSGSILSLVFLRLLPVELPKRGVSVQSVLEGIRFVRSRQAILGAMTLDMFAVIFGGATALLPVYAEEILDVGSLGYGILAASLDVGALGMSIALIFLPPIRRTGRTLLIGVLLYGIFTIIFGLSRWFPLSIAAYAMIGVSDQLSVVARQTTIQLATPDDLRGRVTSVNMLFIGASNRLGAVESGSVAAVTSPAFAVVSGGAACLGVLAVVAAGMPELRRYRIPRPGDPVQGSPATASAAGQ
jgi:MFS family permease